MTMEWRTIPSFPEYEASDSGHIRRSGSTRPLQPSAAGKPGYFAVNLWRGNKGKTHYVHRLVCEAFHGYPPEPGMHAAHWNGNRKDNRPENLRWATPLENSRDRERHGTVNRGSRNGRAVLDEGLIRQIRADVAAAPRSSGGTRLRKGALAAIAGRYGIGRGTVWEIAAGARWGHTP